MTFLIQTNDFHTALPEHSSCYHHHIAIHSHYGELDAVIHSMQHNLVVH